MQPGTPPLQLDESPDAIGESGSYPALAALSAGAGVIHFAMVPAHASDELWHGLAFAAAGWFQLVVAVLLFTRASHRLLGVAIGGNVAILGTWIVSRTAGLPGGSHAWHPEEITPVDLLASALEVGLVVGAAMALAAPAKKAGSLSLGSLVAVVAVLALTTAALASPDARHTNHGDHGTDLAAGGHGDHDDHGAEAETVSLDERCDLDFNTAAYYRDAELAGLDPLGGTGGAGHDHGAVDHSEHSTEEHEEWVDENGEPEASDANQGHDEGEAARNVVELSLMSADDYDAWLQDLDPTRTSGAPDDTQAGGHSGPQPWESMTDPAECDALAADLQVAADTAAAHPTPVEARAAGYVMVTGYVPGIASHWMNFSYVDGEFEVDKPEMLLYDGTGDDAHMIGLSYYIVKEGDQEPTVGFSGNNDHYHRHVGLCVKGTVVIGSSTTTAEDCAARGGTKQGGSGGWMSHAWVVPGCESPWGVFSGENPKLDLGVGDASGQGEPCGGAVRDFDDTIGPTPEAVDQWESAAGD